MSMNTHIRGMPRSTPSSATPDLFSYVPPTPAPGARRTLAKAKSPVAELGHLSDARLHCCCENSRVSSSGARLKAQDGGAGVSLSRPFEKQLVLSKASSRGRQDAQSARRWQMLPRNCRSPSAKPSGQLLQRAWCLSRSLGLRPAACHRTQGAHGRRVGQGQAGRPINLGQTQDTRTTSKTRQMTCPDL